jgi:hypothetical protein
MQSFSFTYFDCMRFTLCMIVGQREMKTEDFFMGYTFIFWILTKFTYTSNWEREERIIAINLTP